MINPVSKYAASQKVAILKVVLLQPSRSLWQPSRGAP